MKKIIIWILVLSFANCGVKKYNLTEKKNSLTGKEKIESQITSLNYIVKLPENWEAILGTHNFLSYSPKNFEDLYYKNVITIHRKNQTQKYSLKDFVQKNINLLNKSIKVDSYSISKSITQYGETYIYKYENNWNFTHYIKTIKYFKKNDNFYIFNYSSDKKYYEKYLADSDFIFNNLKFKEKE